jgi:hypothetical protein
LKGLTWSWIAVGAVVPPIIAVLAAVPLWRRGQDILGNVIGTIVIFGSAIGLIVREYLVIDRITEECLQAGTVCWPEPSAFARFAVYAFVGLVQVIALFSLSLIVEERLRRRSYAPEWRR